MKYNKRHLKRTNYFNRFIATTLLVLILITIVGSAFAFTVVPTSNNIATPNKNTTQSTTNSVCFTTNKSENIKTTVSTTKTTKPKTKSIKPITEKVTKITKPTEIKTQNIKTETTKRIKITNNKNNDKFLLTTDNIDVNYKGTSISLSQYERTELAHLIMGEAGGEGFEGCCLLAQCIRDAMVYRGYSTISEVISGMQYYGYINSTNEDVERAIEYIFDEGNSAVQHRILVMYTTNLCSGEWHETQNFVIQYKSVRFFDMW